MVIARRDPLGARRIFFDPVSGAHAGDLASLLARAPSLAAAGLDPLGVDAAWGLADAPERTCLRAVRSVPPGMSLALAGTRLHVMSSAPSAPPASSAPASQRERCLGATLLGAAARALAGARRPVVALGGGLDAALTVLAARRAGIVVTEAIHLSIPGTGYDESALTRAIASALGLALHEIALSPSELARELARAVRLAETPLYNLHPVSRAVVARVAKQRGYDVLVTGDGADQAACGAGERADYVPVVAAMTKGSGVALASPFLDEALVDRLSTCADPSKRELRELATAWGLPCEHAERPKAACFAPPLPRAAFPEPARLAAVARSLGRALSWSHDDRANVAIASLDAFTSIFGAS
jgi:asparagine synthetase B (glutamine-hydrolysing)